MRGAGGAEAMEERERGRPPTPYARRPTQVVVAAYDATREHNEQELRLAVSGVLLRGDILRGGDTLLVLGVLHTVTNPMGYQTKACTDSFAGTSSRYLDEEMLKKVELYESRLLDSAEKCKEVGVTMKVKITAGTPTKMVVLQEVFSSKASWVILDRYLAPEYAEYGIVSVRTDVYAFGIVLFQLISGKRVLDEQGGQSHHILQWAEPLVESLALHELIDPRIGDSYDTYALYRLAKAAFLCVRRNPELRPSMGEVVRLLEAADDHARHLTQQFIPHYTK